MIDEMYNTSELGIDNRRTRGGVFISLSVKVPRIVSNKTRYLVSKYTTECNIIIVNALAFKEGMVIRYSRNKGCLDEEYNPKKINNRNIAKALALLESKGYVTNTVADRCFNTVETGESSYYVATPALFELFPKGDARKQSKATVIKDTKRVVLKDENKKMVAYKEDDLTQFSNKCLEYYNTYVSEQDIDYLDEQGEVVGAECRLTRIFNGQIGDTGRLYRSEIQNIWYLLRGGIKINGMDTIELDFSNMHLRMLVDLYDCCANLEDVDDAYLLPLSYSESLFPKNREAVKKSFNLMLNCKSRNSAVAAIQYYLNIENRETTIRSGSEMLNKIINGFSFLPLDAILWQSKPMAYKLQRIDSDIALEIIMCAAEQGIVVLPIHDSFITPVEHKLWLQDIMKHTYRKHLGQPNVQVPISVTFKGKIWKEWA